MVVAVEVGVEVEVELPVVVLVLVYEVLAVEVAEVVFVVVGVVISQSPKLPSANELIAGFTASAAASHSPSTTMASSILHDSLISTVPRLYSSTILVSDFTTPSQSVDGNTALPLISAPHETASFLPLHLDSNDERNPACAAHLSDSTAAYEVEPNSAHFTSPSTAVLVAVELTELVGVDDVVVSVVVADELADVVGLLLGVVEIVVD